MIIANLLGRTKMPLLYDYEVTAWEASDPLDQDIVFNIDTKTFFVYDGTAGQAVDMGGPVTVWKVDSYAPGSGSYMTISETTGKKVLMFGLTDLTTGVSRLLMVKNSSAANFTEVYHNVNTGVFELYIGATPASQFNGEWVTVIYNNDLPPV